MRNDLFNARNRMPDALDLTVRDALRWGTANGAHAMGLEERIGSLTPGQAGRRDRDRRPAAEHGADGRPGGLPGGAGQRRRTSQHVLVAGRFVKRDGELVGRRRGPGGATWRRRPRSGCWARSADGEPLLPPAPEGFADMLNTVAAGNLARAWAIEPS